MTDLETVGFLKIDFLGLKNLTLIDRTVKMILKNHGVAIDIDRLPLDDPKTFALLCAGNTSGVFQLESSGLKEVLRKLQPDKFEDIIAVNALYRPGPLGSGMVDDFIERRHGRQKALYIFPEIEPILEETYGVIVYQEQVIKIASAIAGYSLGEADILRKAMGKKKAEVMAEQAEIFVKKSAERGFNAQKAKELFDLMAFFAGYGFNKSHSAAYAMIAYQTAYLKANYPAEFMAGLISLEAANAEKMTFYLEEAKSMDLEIMPPDINNSEIDFSVVNGKIVFGLQGIKNVGITALQNILAERTRKPFTDILELCTRVDLRTVNKRVLEHLIWAGAFDKLAGNRAQKTAELTTIIEQAAERKRALQTGQMGLFGAAATSSQEPNGYTFQALAPWNDKEKLAKELEVIGFYLSAHPLDSYRKQLKRLSLTPFLTALEETKANNTLKEYIVTNACFLKGKRTINTKKGDKMAFVQVEDHSSEAELVVFPKVYKQAESWLSEYNVFVVKGSVDAASQTKCKILAQELVPLELFFQEWKTLTAVTLHLPAEATMSLVDISKVLPKGKIPLSLTFKENGKRLRLKTQKTVSIDTPLIEQLEAENIMVTFHV